MVFSGQDKFCLTMILIFPQSDALFRFYYYFKLLILASGIYLTTDFSQKIPASRAIFTKRNVSAQCCLLNLLFLKTSISYSVIENKGVKAFSSTGRSETFDIRKTGKLYQLNVTNKSLIYLPRSSQSIFSFSRF